MYCVLRCFLAVQSKLGTTEVDPLMEGEGDGASTLLGSSQLSGPEDYWFFFNRVIIAEHLLICCYKQEERRTSSDLTRN